MPRPEALVVALLLSGGPAGAGVYLRPPEALRLAFPRARVVRRTVFLRPGQQDSLQARARVKLSGRIISYYPAFAGDSLVGAAFFDTRTVRTMPGTFMVVVDPDSTVSRVEVLSLHEPEDYRPPVRWLSLFTGRRLDDSLWPKRGIYNLGGATLSARAVTESVRLALALYGLVDLSPPRAREGEP